MSIDFTETSLDQIKRSLQAEDHYKNYRVVKDYVTTLVQQDRNISFSDYWNEEVAGFSYMFDASPFITRSLREHCYHITGIRAYEYRSHHNHQAELFKVKLNRLQKRDTRNLLVPENSAMGGFGHVTDYGLINIDTLKFYESLIAMDRFGLLPDAESERQIVAEIGSGWGGFAYQFKTLFPNTTYLLIDLPHTMLFSATYLKTVFKGSKFLLFDGADHSSEDFKHYDFVFMPPAGFEQIGKLDLMINMVSFQEMAESQVENYIAMAKETGCPAVYSHNRGRSKHNNQIEDVSKILKRHYNLSETKVLPEQYTNLQKPKKKSNSKLSFYQRAIARVSNKPVTTNKRQKPSVHDYRHLLGRI